MSATIDNTLLLRAVQQLRRDVRKIKSDVETCKQLIEEIAGDLWERTGEEDAEDDELPETSNEESDTGEEGRVFVSATSQEDSHAGELLYSYAGQVTDAHRFDKADCEAAGGDDEERLKKRQREIHPWSQTKKGKLPASLRPGQPYTV